MVVVCFSPLQLSSHCLRLWFLPSLLSLASLAPYIFLRAWYPLAEDGIRHPIHAGRSRRSAFGGRRRRSAHRRRPRARWQNRRPLRQPHHSQQRSHRPRRNHRPSRSRAPPRQLSSCRYHALRHHRALLHVRWRNNPGPRSTPRLRRRRPQGRRSPFLFRNPLPFQPQSPGGSRLRRPRLTLFPSSHHPPNGLPLVRVLCYDGPCNHRGEVTEWLKVLASKASIRGTVSWVRIPPSPPYLSFPAYYCILDSLLPPCYRFSSFIGDGVQHGQRLRKVQRPPGMGVSKGWKRPPAEGREVPYSLHRRTRQAVLESTLRYSAASPGKRGWRGPGYPSRCPRTHRR